MAALSFDDLIPQTGSPAPIEAPRGPVTFDDLIPQGPAQAAPVAAPAAADARPWYAQAGQAADDLARLAASGVTFGYADKLAGALSGTGTAAERARTEEARERAGGAGMVAEYGTPLIPATALSRAGLTLAQQVPKAISNIGTRAAAAGVEGAGWGALNAAGHDENLSTGAKIGALAGAAGQPIAEGLSTAVGGVASLFNKRPPLPTAAETKALGHASYEAADRAGVIVKPDFVKGLASDIRGALADEGYTPNLHGRVAAALGEIDNAAGQNVTLKGLDTMRKVARNVAQDQDPSTSRLGSMMIDKIDEAVGSMNLGHVLTGNKTEGVKALQEARQLWRQGRMTETIDGLMERATNQAASSGTGGNLDNAIRQQFKGYLNSKQGRFLTEDERDAFRTIIRGTDFQNMARLVGRLAPTSGALPMLANLTAAGATGGLSVGASAAAMGARAAGEQATKNNVYALARIIANNGTAPPAIQNAVQRLAQSERETLARILMSWGVQGGLASGLGAALP